MSDTLPDVIHDEAVGRFEMTVDGLTAFTEYRRMGSGLLFPHTEVPPPLEGRGIAGAIVRAAMAYARAEGQKVIPVCTFVAGYLIKHPELHDIVHPDYRKALGID